MPTSNISDLVALIAAYAIPGLFAITVHEVAHGWVARQFGDRTAEMLGRLTLNPIKHIDVVGTIIVPVLLLIFTGFVFGWAKPVPISSRNLKNPKRDMVFVAAAGPIANLIMGVFWALVLAVSNSLGVLDSSFGAGIMLMCRAGIVINAVLAVFNLLPLPPLDGGRVLSGLLPLNLSRVYDRIEPYGLMIVVLLMVTNILWRVLSPGIFAVTGLLNRLAGL